MRKKPVRSFQQLRRCFRRGSRPASRDLRVVIKRYKSFKLRSDLAELLARDKADSKLLAPQLLASV